MKTSQKIYSAPDKPKHYLVNWNPSEKTKQLIHRICTFRENGITFRQIAIALNMTQQYVQGLHSYYSQYMKGGDNSEKQSK